MSISYAAYGEHAGLKTFGFIRMDNLPVYDQLPNAYYQT